MTFSFKIVEGSGRQRLFLQSQIQLRMSVHVLLISIFLENFAVIFSTLKPIKTLEIVPSREHPGGFCDFNCCYFSMPPALQPSLSDLFESIHQLCALPWLLLVAYSELVCFILLRALRF